MVCQTGVVSQRLKFVEQGLNLLADESVAADCGKGTIMTTTIEQDIESKNQRICSRLVEREVLHCISATVDLFVRNQGIFADGIDGISYDDDILPLLEADDWETPGREHINGMDRDELLDYLADTSIEEQPIEELRELAISQAEVNWWEFCDDRGLDCERNEALALEHWAVTKWFRGKLDEHGEIVGELLDFDVWGRCCSGQAISQDGVIRAIASEMEILVGQKNDWSKNDG